MTVKMAGLATLMLLSLVACSANEAQPAVFGPRIHTGMLEPGIGAGVREQSGAPVFLEYSNITEVTRALFPNTMMTFRMSDASKMYTLAQLTDFLNNLNNEGKFQGKTSPYDLPGVMAENGWRGPVAWWANSTDLYNYAYIAGDKYQVEYDNQTYQVDTFWLATFYPPDNGQPALQPNEVIQFYISLDENWNPVAEITTGSPIMETGQATLRDA
jgi:hypothetical protein